MQRRLAPTAVGIRLPRGDAGVKHRHTVCDVAESRIDAAWHSSEVPDVHSGTLRDRRWPLSKNLIAIPELCRVKQALGGHGYDHDDAFSRGNAVCGQQADAEKALSTETEILVVSSCTGLKSRLVGDPELTPAADLYIGDQHRHLMAGISEYRGAREPAGPLRLTI